HCSLPACGVLLLFFTDPASSKIHTLSLHDALPIYGSSGKIQYAGNVNFYGHDGVMDVTLSNPVIVVENSSSAKLQTQFQGNNIRSEEHTSELQSRFDLVCRLLLEKKKKYNPRPHSS